jgi:hypothetical protein
MTLPWYKSRILMGALLSAVLKLLVLTGVAGDLAPADQAAWLDIVLLVASFAGDALAAHGRLTQTAAPTITATKGPTDA